jgi:hypothetical protein
MNVYLILAFVLLLAMLFLVLRPWLLATEPTLEGPVDVSDPAARARSVARVERVGRPADAATETTAAVVLDPEAEAVAEPAAEPVVEGGAAPAAPPVMDSSSDAVRASVEAAIAARKAALKAKHCTACEAVLEAGDAFCRSCGTKVTA